MTQAKISSIKNVSSQHSPWSEIVCWSRMQAEGGQQLDEIVARKEIERSVNDGVFCWGVGNAPNRSTAGLARSGAEIDVLFSVMKSRPKLIDVAPSLTLVWRKFIDYDGHQRTIPHGSLITSKGETQGGIKRSHFALFCKSTSPLIFGDFGSFDPAAYRNVGEVGGSIGPSQVTALLRRIRDESPEGGYRINLRAKMFGGYWVKLIDPIPMDLEKQRKLSIFVSSLSQKTADQWSELVRDLRNNDKPSAWHSSHQLHLL